MQAGGWAGGTGVIQRDIYMKLVRFLFRFSIWTYVEQLPPQTPHPAFTNTHIWLPSKKSPQPLEGGT